METYFLDFESYYSREYSLRRMTAPEYVLDPRFELHGCAVKKGVHGATSWIDGPDFGAWLATLDPAETCFVAHNALFDFTITSYLFGFTPRLMVDTLGVSRAVLGHELKSHSLENVAKHLGLGVKGKTILKVEGMNAAAIKAAGYWQEYIAYACNDDDLCAGVYGKLVLSGRFPAGEIAVMNMVLRCAINPKFLLDQNVLALHLAQVKADKESLLQKVGGNRDALMSNDKFAVMLQELGVDPPRKISLTTGNETWAFAKTDSDFLDLEEHEDPRVQSLMAARLGVKTTLEETRTERLLAIARLQWPHHPPASMPIPLRYGAAHTHRLGGEWKINMQNLPRGGALRRALIAPPNHVVIAPDSSQIEARINAWICGQHDLVAAFERGEDVYSLFASKLFGRPVTKKDKKDRFLGKTCLAAGTLIYTNKGLVPIEHITTEHLLWDGVEWVCHRGLLSNGSKETLTISGLSLTPDHLVLCGMQWKEARSLEHDAATRSQALATGAESLSSLVTSEVFVEAPLRSSFDATVGDPSTLSTRTTLGRSSRPDALRALRRRAPASVTGPTLRLLQMMGTGLAYSTGSQQQLLGAIATHAVSSDTTAGEVSRSTTSGAPTAPPSCDTSSQYLGGIDQTSRWIGSTSTATTRLEISGSLVGARTSATSGRSPTSRQRLPVYDIACAGPRHRFMVATSDGPLIVHNCILGLGYGMGWEKFQRTVSIQSRNQLGELIQLSDIEAQRAVGVYRSTYAHMTEMRRLLHQGGVPALAGHAGFELPPCLFEHEAVLLPNGLRLHYKDLEYKDNEWVFTYAGKPKRIYGGKLLENVVQALARIVVMDAGLRIQKRLAKAGIELAMQVHDELVYVVPTALAEVVQQIVLQEMSVRPDWAPGLPLAAECDIGPNYGEAK